jgi:anti-sigma B factor antagonist
VLEVETEGSGTVDVIVRGELDMHHAAELRKAITDLLNRGDVTAINLDLTGLELLDATGAGTLIVAHRIAINVRVALRLWAVSAPAAQVLTLIGAADLLPGGQQKRPEQLGGVGPGTARTVARRGADVVLAAHDAGRLDMGGLPAGAPPGAAPTSAPPWPGAHTGRWSARSAAPGWP